MVAEVRMNDREKMYRLMIGQLLFDGHQEIAFQLNSAIQCMPIMSPSDRLAQVLSKGFDEEEKIAANDPPNFKRLFNDGIDFDNALENRVLGLSLERYETYYVTSHRDSCRASAFDPAGQYAATASADSSIKILSLAKMLNRNCSSGDNEFHPVVRNLYDHSGEVTCVEFHPTVPHYVISGSRDCTIKFFDYSKPMARKAFRMIQEAAEIADIGLHVSGDYLLVATSHPTLRLYDVNTNQCFVSSVPSDQHTASLTSVNWSNCGKYFATSSVDGNIALWDGVSCKRFNTFVKAHSGTLVESVVFSRNSKYVLTAGCDGIVKLWDISSARCIQAYRGHAPAEMPLIPCPAVFTHTEDFVLGINNEIRSIYCWDARTAELINTQPFGHTDVVRFISHSNKVGSLVTCSDDNRCRFWCSDDFVNFV